MVIKENTIFRYDNVVDPSVCDRILEYYDKNHKNELNDINTLPWFEQNTLYWYFLKNTEIKNEISLCRDKITELIFNSYNTTVYPNTTTLVMWKEGKYMDLHKDNGYENDEHLLSVRIYTAVMYINDDFEGGETVIMKENSDEIEYVSIPKKGSVIVFKSDESCLHGVNKIKSGNRLTLSMWFTVDSKYSEN